MAELSLTKRIYFFSLCLLTFYSEHSRNVQVVLALAAFAALHLLIKEVRVPKLVIGFVSYLSILGLFQVAHLEEDWTALVLTSASLIIGACSVQYLGLRLAAAALLIGTTCLASYAIYLGVFHPEIGLVSGFYEAGSLKGPLIHRNLLGMLCAFGLALGVLFLKLTWLKRKLIHISMAVNLIALIWSQSFNSISAASVAVLFVFFLDPLTGSILRKRARVYALAFFILILPIGLLLYASEGTSIFGLVQRDETLTGRTVIWSAVLHEFPSLLPWGEGWNRLWQPDDAMSVSIWSQIGFIVFHSHQAFIDVLARGGIFCFLVVSIILADAIFIKGIGQGRDQNLTVTRTISAFILALSFGEAFFHLAFGAMLLGVLAGASKLREDLVRRDAIKSVTSVT